MPENITEIWMDFSSVRLTLTEMSAYRAEHGYEADPPPKLVRAHTAIVKSDKGRHFWGPNVELAETITAIGRTVHEALRKAEAIAAQRGLAAKVRPVPVLGRMTPNTIWDGTDTEGVWN